MGCKRCGGTLERFELGGNLATSCEKCGFVDVSVSHEPERPPSESWAEAIDRFNRRQFETETADDVSVLESAIADD